jgi:hypothetical protein
MLKTALTIFLLAGPMLAAEAIGDNPEVLTEIKIAERSIDGRFKDISGSDPMGLIGFTRGGYLNDFGTVFSFEVMLVPVANVTPFRPKYTDEEKKKLNIRKRQRLEDLEMKAQDILVAEGCKLEAVPASQKVALVISLFHFAWEDRSNLPSQLVMQTTRQNLLDRQAARLDKQEFRKRLDVRYF